MPASSSETRRWKKKPKHEPQIDELQEDENDNLENDSDSEPPQPNPTSDPSPEPETLSGTGICLSNFPSVVRHVINRPHASVLGVLAAERAARAGETPAAGGGVALENVSHGQLQALASVPRGCAALMAAGEPESADVAAKTAADFVIAPPKIVAGSGVVKRVGGKVHVVPMHADWFSTNGVHRLERQVVPHFFSGKSAEYTSEKYMECRNRIVYKYMENPETRLTLSSCQGWVSGFAIDDLTRIVRFLDHWGIINYCASALNSEPQSDSSCLRESSNGEVHVPSAALKSIDSLIKFDKPRCKVKAADIYSSLPCHDCEEADLDSKIREHFSENRCSFCSCSVPIVYYQSQKEVDSLLCVDCFNDGRFVTGHSSIDFVRLDTSRYYDDLDGESWTNQETLLLLEALEVYNENWNEIAEHVGSKSKAQCILQFIRLPTEDGPLENIEVPSMSSSSSRSKKDLSIRPHSSSNGDSAGSHVQDPDLESELPFANSANPVMSLVAFLASAVGPRVAAACAHASLAVLSEDPHNASERIDASDVSKRNDAEGMQFHEGYSHGDFKNSEYNSEVHDQENQNGEVTPLSADKVRTAAKAGLAAAATKAKLFGDHEEREIQRLSANIINHQLKRLELKLKQFAEIETLLMKECEQVERLKQRFSGERTRIISAQFGNPGGTSTVNNQPGIANNTMTNRQLFAAASTQPFVSSGYHNNNNNNINNNNNNNNDNNNNNNQPSIQLMGRQQMYGLGPRLPLSALHPASSTSPNAMYNNSPANTQPSPNHPTMRSLSGASSSLG